MNYKAKLKSGEELLLQNDGQQTRVQLKSGDSSSHESQGTSFETGKWGKTPELFEMNEGAVLKIEGEKGPFFLHLQNNAIERLDAAPALNDATKIELKATEESPSSISMKPMAPMKPMEPLKPLA